jgi:hypothetical protein
LSESLETEKHNGRLRDRFHNHHDEEKRRELEEKASANGFKIYRLQQI